MTSLESEDPEARTRRSAALLDAARRLWETQPTPENEHALRRALEVWQADLREWVRRSARDLGRP